jgi:hypothetical protein
MKLLHIMMAKELLDLQIEQVCLSQEELSLQRKVMDIDQKLGLCTQDWYDKQVIRLQCKRIIYNDILEDYQMSQMEIAKLEQVDAENNEEIVDTNNTALLGDDTPKEESISQLKETMREEFEDADFEVEEQESPLVKEKVKANT